MVPIVDTLTGISMATVIVVGGQMVLQPQLDVGVMVAFLFYIQRFFDPIRSLTMQYSVMQRAMTSGQRITEVLDVPVDIKDKPDAVALTRDMDGSVEFKNVTFGYRKNQPVLQERELQGQSGRDGRAGRPDRLGQIELHVAGPPLLRRVGRRGAGRRARCARRDPGFARRAGRHGAAGAVPVHRHGDREHPLQQDRATREEVIEAAKAVGAHDFIMQLPDGYDTKLEQRGGNLSLGQRQLLSFARALVADAKILVLDEATANIDSYTEMQIQKALEMLLEGPHRPRHRPPARDHPRRRPHHRAAERRDLIESGNHDQLMAKNGLYAKLYNMNYSELRRYSGGGTGRSRTGGEGDLGKVGAYGPPPLLDSKLIWLMPNHGNPFSPAKGEKRGGIISLCRHNRATASPPPWRGRTVCRATLLRSGLARRGEGDRGADHP